MEEPSRFWEKKNVLRETPAHLSDTAGWALIMSAGFNLCNSGNSDQLSLEIHSLLQKSVEKSSRHLKCIVHWDEKRITHVISYRFIRSKVVLRKCSWRRSSELHYWWPGCNLRDALAKYNAVSGWKQAAISLLSSHLLQYAVKENFTNKNRKTNMTGMSRGPVDLLRCYYPFPCFSQNHWEGL